MLVEGLGARVALGVSVQVESVDGLKLWARSDVDVKFVVGESSPSGAVAAASCAALVNGSEFDVVAGLEVCLL